MPEIPDVTPGEPVESDWGNQIRNRTVQRYADAAERDGLVPLPVAGDLAYLDDSGTVTLFDGTTWKSGTAPGVYVAKAGDSMQGELNMQGNAIFGLPAPNNDGDAASKGYVDGVALPGQLLDAYSLISVPITVTGSETDVMTYDVPTTPGVPIVITADAWFRSNTTPAGSSWYGGIEIAGVRTLAAWASGTDLGTFITFTDVHQLTHTPSGTSVRVSNYAQIITGAPATFFGTQRVNTYRAP